MIEKMDKENKTLLSNKWFIIFISGFVFTLLVAGLILLKLGKVF